MNILVFGYYNYGNLGDELFRLAFQKLFPHCSLTFCNLDEKCPQQKYDLVFLGGGDVMNEYFLERFQGVVASVASVPIVAFGVGFGGAAIDSSRLWMFDSVVTRNTDALLLHNLNRRFAAPTMTCIPDLVFFLDLPGPPDAGILPAVALVPSGDRIAPADLDRLLESSPGSRSFIFDSKQDSHLRGKIVTRPEDFGGELVVTYKFHGLVLAVMSRRLVVCDDQSFKCAELMRRIFGEPLARRLCFSSLSKALCKDIKTCICIAKENQDEVLARIDAYLAYVRLVRECWTPDDFLTMLKIKGARPKESDEAIYRKLSAQSLDNVLKYFKLGKNSPYVWGMSVKRVSSPADIRWLAEDLRAKSFATRPFNIDCFVQRFSEDTHRYGWNYVIRALNGISGKYGTFLDTFLDSSYNSKPYLFPWIGIVHHPENVPARYSDAGLARLVSSSFFKLSIPFCKQLIVLSTHLKGQLAKYFDRRKISVVLHPMSTRFSRWSLSEWMSRGRKLFMIGNWMRNVFSIYRLNYKHKYVITSHYYSPPRSIFVYRKAGEGGAGLGSQGGGNCAADFEEHGSGCTPSQNSWLFCANLYLNPLGFEVTDVPKPGETRDTEVERYLCALIRSVNVVPHLGERNYDVTLRSSVVILDLFDCSASNTLLECVMSSTPIYLPRLPAIEEYVGKDYPLFFSDVGGIVVKYGDLVGAHRYLLALDKQRFFVDSFTQSMLQITKHM